MKDTTKLLKRIISQDTKYVESMRRSLKDDEFTIRRLQNKSRSLEKKIEECKQLIKEYRNHLMSTSEAAQTKAKLVPSTEQQMDKQSSTTKIELVKV
jgi:predicted RNase H-like nuclease (RuvC/YqgF family)